MNCGDWEERIALYAGGDLRPEEAAGLERHLAECAGCQLLLSGLRESLRLLREAHAEPVEEAHFTAVRARVFAELERGRWPWWRQVWVYGLAAAAMALLLLAVRPKAHNRIAVVTPAPVLTAAPAPPQPQTVRQSVAPRHRKPRPKPAAEAERPAEPLVVKLLTDDPNVVIYWITESKGD
jgi:anti-sigma factor RsiW